MECWWGLVGPPRARPPPPFVSCEARIEVGAGSGGSWIVAVSTNPSIRFVLVPFRDLPEAALTLTVPGPRCRWRVASCWRPPACSCRHAPRRWYRKGSVPLARPAVWGVGYLRGVAGRHGADTVVGAEPPSRHPRRLPLSHRGRRRTPGRRRRRRAVDGSPRRFPRRGPPGGWRGCAVGARSGVLAPGAP